jgi:hypothetical protein
MNGTRQTGEVVAFRWKALGACWTVVPRGSPRPPRAEALVTASDLEQVIRERDEAVKLLEELATYTEALGRNIERNDVDMHLDTVERPLSAVQPARAFLANLEKTGG